VRLTRPFIERLAGNCLGRILRDAAFGGSSG
jgi:hypothetical protein